MIAPEPADGINPQTARAANPPATEPGRLGPLLLRTLAFSVLIFALLEVWRPYFFLTDDNVDGGLPFFTEVGQNLLAGRSPFVSHHLFGGDYNFLRDPNFFAWHPAYLLISLLEATPLRIGIIDADAFFMLMLATAGFVTLAHYLRRELPLTISDNWITFFALSYTYTMIALATGASWLSFLGDVASLPWLALGIVHKSWWRGALIVMLAMLNALLGGHLEPAVSNSIFLSLFALGLGIGQRSVIPLANWFLGYAAALLLILPLLLPMLDGFSHSLRAGGIVLSDMQQNNVAAQDFASSVFIGMTLWLFHPHQHPYITYILALGSSAAAWCLLPALVGRTRWRPIEMTTLLMLVLGVVLITRPLVITEVMARLPLLKSMRWPFREFIQFQFFLHLFMLVRPPGAHPPARVVLAALGTCVFVIPLVLYPFAPSFNTMNWDRELLITGGYQDYWAKVRPFLKPTDRVAVIIPLDVYKSDRFEEPYTLMGTYNYAEMDGIINAWGYSPTWPRDQVYTQTWAYYPFGAYLPMQRAELLAEKPDLKFITLESLQPLRITLSSRDGPVIDLTPFVPVRHSRIPPHPPNLP